MRAWLAWWLILAGLYLLLADSVVVPELVVGAVAAAVGATGAILVRRHRQPLHLRARWLRGSWRPVLGIFADLVPLARVLVVRGRGTLVEVPFDATGEGAEDAAYRACTQALGSLAPNTVVVDIDAERGVLLAHQLVPTSDPAAKAAPVPR